MAIVNVVMPTWAVMESAIWGEVMSIAKEAERYWKSIAPYDPESKHPQHYRDSIHTVVIREKGRMKARVYTKDFKAHWIEYGTKKMEALAPMDRTRNHIENGGGS